MAKLQDNELAVSPGEEQALFDRLAEGDRDALAQFYRLYYERLFRFAYRLTNSFGAAEELVNDVILAVWKGSGEFRSESKISTWVFGIAYRRCMSHLRRKRIATVPEVSVEHIADESGASLEDSQWINIGGYSYWPDRTEGGFLILRENQLPYATSLRVVEGWRNIRQAM